MEREKQKCAEKERERREHAAMLEQRKLTESAAAAAAVDAEGVPLFVKSKFVSVEILNLFMAIKDNFAFF